MDSIVWREFDVSSASHRWASRNPSIIRARIGVTAIFFANGFAVGAWAVAIPLVKALFGLWLKAGAVEDGLLRRTTEGRSSRCSSYIENGYSSSSKRTCHRAKQRRVAG